MTSTLITNIKCLYGTGAADELLKGKALSNLPVLEDAYLVVEGNEIATFGEMKNLPAVFNSTLSVNAKGSFVLPAWCDSHTHIVYAGSREHEFEEKIKGLSYAEIAAAGGGILNSSEKLNLLSEDALFNESWKRLIDVSKLGTGAIEIKSGYGLTVEGELKMLRVVKRLREKSSLLIKSTFLGAHTYPTAYANNHQGYIDLIINEMLPVIAAEKLADYIDVFCEQGFFSPVEMEKICNAGMQYGLKPKLHVNQLNSIGAIEAGISCNAVSLDHLETMSSADMERIRRGYAIDGWKGCCTLLPGAAFFLRMNYPPARALIDAGAAIALASDYNPGSAPSGNMNLVIALACIQMKMLPEEAINAATINGAFAMGVEKQAGSIAVGKKANLLFTKPIPSLAYLPYSFGSNLIDKVMIAGEFI